MLVPASGPTLHLPLGLALPSSRVQPGTATRGRRALSRPRHCAAPRGAYRLGCKRALNPDPPVPQRRASLNRTRLCVWHNSCHTLQVPFWGPTEPDIFKKVLTGTLDMKDGACGKVSRPAKELLLLLLNRDPEVCTHSSASSTSPSCMLGGWAPS